MAERPGDEFGDRRVNRDRRIAIADAVAAQRGDQVHGHVGRAATVDQKVTSARPIRFSRGRSRSRSAGKTARRDCRRGWRYIMNHAGRDLPGPGISSGARIVDLVEHGVSWGRHGRRLAIGGMNNSLAHCQGGHKTGSPRHHLARDVGLIGMANGGKGLAGDRTAVEDQHSIQHLDGCRGQADARLTNSVSPPAGGTLRRHRRSGRRERIRPERRKGEGEAVARIAVRPFGDHQIVANVERRQHRARRDAERGDDEAPERPGGERQDEQEASSPALPGFAAAGGVR